MRILNRVLGKGFVLIEKPTRGSSRFIVFFLCFNLPWVQQLPYPFYLIKSNAKSRHWNLIYVCKSTFKDLPKLASSSSLSISSYITRKGISSWGCTWNVTAARFPRTTWPSTSRKGLWPTSLKNASNFNNKTNSVPNTLIACFPFVIFTSQVITIITTSPVLLLIN